MSLGAGDTVQPQCTVQCDALGCHCPRLQQLHAPRQLAAPMRNLINRDPFPSQTPRLATEQALAMWLSCLRH